MRSRTRTGNLLGELVSWRAVAAALLLVLVAIVLLWMASGASADASVFRKEVIPAIASVAATSGIFALVYEVFVRRQQTEFVLDAIGLRESLIRAGLSDITLNYLDFDYGKAISEAKQVRIVVLYAQTWLNRYAVEIQEHLRKSNTVFELVVPSPNNPFMGPMEAHFKYESGGMTERVVESIKLCTSEAINGSMGSGSIVRVYAHKSMPCYSMYKFDNSILVGTYYSSSSRRRAPMFMFAEGPGSMYEEFDTDASDVLTKESELVFDSAKSVNRIEEVFGQCRRDASKRSAPD